MITAFWVSLKNLIFLITIENETQIFINNNKKFTNYFYQLSLVYNIFIFLMQNLKFNLFSYE